MALKQTCTQIVTTLSSDDFDKRYGGEKFILNGLSLGEDGVRKSGILKDGQDFAIEYFRNSQVEKNVLQAKHQKAHLPLNNTFTFFMVK